MNKDWENMTDEQIQAQIQEREAVLERRKRERFLKDYQYLKEQWGEDLERFILNVYEELQCEKGQTQEVKQADRRASEVESFKKAALINTQKRIKSSGGYANSTPRGFFGEDKQQKPKPEPETYDMHSVTQSNVAAIGEHFLGGRADLLEDIPGEE